MDNIMSMKQKVGREIKIRVLVDSITRTTKDGNRWVDLFVSDRTGKTVLKVWGENITDEVEQLLQVITGCVIECNGLVEMYDGSLSLRVYSPSLKLAEEGTYDDADFFPAVGQTGQERLFARKEALIERLKELNSKYTVLVETVYNKFGSRMAKLPGGTKEHSYRGGLLLHQVEVAEFAASIAKSYEQGRMDAPYGEVLDEGLIIAASLLHDLGKLLAIEALGTKTRLSVRGLWVGSSTQTILSLCCINNELKDGEGRVEDIAELVHCIEACETENEVPVRCAEAQVCRMSNEMSEKLGAFNYSWNEYDRQGKTSSIMYSKEQGTMIIRRKEEFS